MEDNLINKTYRFNLNLNLEVASSNKTKKLCIFDLDGTLTKESSGLKLTSALCENGIFQKNVWDQMIELEERYRSCNYKDSYDDYVRALSKHFAKGLSGAQVENVEKIAHEVAENLNYREGCWEVISELKKRKFDLYIISASPSPIVKAISLKLGINNAYGLEVHVKNGIYQAVCKRIMTSEQKMSIIKVISKVYDFSIGVGDTINDMIAYSNLHLRFLLGANNSIQDILDVSMLRIDRIEDIISYIESWNRLSF